MSEIVSGKCRYCKCTPEHPCRVYPFGADDTCAWLPGTSETVCNGSPCVIKWERDQKAVRKRPLSRFQQLIKEGHGFGSAREIVQREEQNARRRRRRKKAA